MSRFVNKSISSIVIIHYFYIVSYPIEGKTAYSIKINFPNGSQIILKIRFYVKKLPFIYLSWQEFDSKINL